MPGCGACRTELVTPEAQQNISRLFIVLDICGLGAFGLGVVVCSFGFAGLEASGLNFRQNKHGTSEELYKNLGLGLWGTCFGHLGPAAVAGLAGTLLAPATPNPSNDFMLLICEL